MIFNGSININRKGFNKYLGLKGSNEEDRDRDWKRFKKPDQPSEFKSEG